MFTHVNGLFPHFVSVRLQFSMTDSEYIRSKTFARTDSDCILIVSECHLIEVLPNPHLIIKLLAINFKHFGYHRLYVNLSLHNLYWYTCICILSVICVDMYIYNVKAAMNTFYSIYAHYNNIIMTWMLTHLIAIIIKRNMQPAVPFCPLVWVCHALCPSPFHHAPCPGPHLAFCDGWWHGVFLPGF